MRSPRLRHSAYRIVLNGDSFRMPRPMPEPDQTRLAKSAKRNASLSPFESAFYFTSNWRHYGDHPRRHYADP
jgi:hypothetical protein